jgi:hypothetical protein
MARLLASLLVCVVAVALGGCHRGRIGIIIETDGSFDATAVSRLHLKVSDSEKTGEGSQRIRFDANIDRGAQWDGHLPVSLIYDGISADPWSYYPTVAAYAGDQIIAQSNGYVLERAWFSNVEWGVRVRLESLAPAYD